jgi:hypothetical protein
MGASAQLATPEHRFTLAMLALNSGTNAHVDAFDFVDAGCQPGAREKVDAAYFPGFWLRQQRIGTRFT